MANQTLVTTSQNNHMDSLTINGSAGTLSGRDVSKWTLTKNSTGNYSLVPVVTQLEPPTAMCMPLSTGVMCSLNQANTVSLVQIIATSMGTIGQTAGLLLNGIQFYAEAPGTAGNAITITITGGATAGSEVVTSTSAGAITIQVQTTVSTATQVYAALKAAAVTGGQLAFVSYILVTGATTWATAAAANLTGGVTAVASGVTDATIDVRILACEKPNTSTLE